MRAARLAVLAAALTLLPRLALACSACVSSPYGDRAYNWGYIGLLLMPFAVGCVIAGILAWNAGYRLDLARVRQLRKAMLKETP